MKETGIIMSGNQTKLILDGTKTQTRRVIKPQPPNTIKTIFRNMLRWDWWWYEFGSNRPQIKCPYGQVGDRLWVRETFNLVYWDEAPYTDITYKADWQEWLKAKRFSDPSFEPQPVKWRPSIHMPRWASRITLEITEVRVERLQEISQQDALDEGIAFYAYKLRIDSRERFADLWDSLNAKRGYGWGKNPFVWVISFKEE